MTDLAPAPAPAYSALKRGPSSRKHHLSFGQKEEEREKEKEKEKESSGEIDMSSRAGRPPSRGMQRWRSLSRLVGGVSVFQNTPIKVFVRIRPFLGRELHAGAQRVVNVRDEKHLTIQRPNRSDDAQEKSFEGCFWSFDVDEELRKGGRGSQEDVFKQAAYPLIESAFNGYDCTLIAYGSTGSGKSYTIFGGKARKFGAAPDFAPTKVVKTPGVIHMLADVALKRLKENREMVERADDSFTAQISLVEIYNEQIRDLLQPTQDSGHLRLREYPNLGLYIEGLSKHGVASPEDFHRTLALGMKSRSVLRTRLSEESSRAHTIMTVYLNLEAEEVTASLSGGGGAGAGTEGDSAAVPAGTGELKEVNLGTDYRTSKLTVVDLAGTERTDQRGARRANVDRLKEAMAINKSLLALNRVIRELWSAAEKEKEEEKEKDGKKKKQSKQKPQQTFGHKDSILTRVLHESFGGNCRTTMIATLSPADSSLEQSLLTIQYADMTQSIINKPKVNRNSEFRALHVLHAEVAVLKRKSMEVKLSMKTLNQPADIAISEALLADVLNQIKERELVIEELETPPEIREERAKELRAKFELELQRLGVGVGEGENDEELRRAIPHLVQLTDDASMGSLVYFLRPDKTLRFGSDSSCVEVVLFGIGIQPEHCTLSHTSADHVVTLMPLSPLASVCVNGATVTSSIELETGDRVVLGTSYFFRFVNPVAVAQSSLDGQTPGSKGGIRRAFTFSRARAVTMAASGSSNPLPPGLLSQMEQRQRDSVDLQRGSLPRLSETDGGGEGEDGADADAGREGGDTEAQPDIDKGEEETDDDGDDEEDGGEEDEYEMALKELHSRDIDKMAEVFAESENVPDKLLEHRELVATMESDYKALEASFAKNIDTWSDDRIDETQATMEVLKKSIDEEKSKLERFEELVREQATWEAMIMDVLARAFPQVREANGYAEILQKPATFELRLVPQIVQTTGNEFGRVIRGDVAIVYTNTDSKLTNEWDYDRFSERLFVMRELYTKYMSSPTHELPDVDRDLDPFYESPEVYRRLGQASVAMQSLCYLFPVEGPVSVLANSGEVVCELNITIKPIVMVYDSKGMASPLQSPHVMTPRSDGTGSTSSSAFPFPSILPGASGSEGNLSVTPTLGPGAANIDGNRRGSRQLVGSGEGGSGRGSRTGSGAGAGKLNPALERVRTGVSPMVGRGRAMSFMENPDELVSRRMDVQISISGIIGNNSDFKNGVYCRFKFWGMDDDVETSPSFDNDVNVSINHQTSIRIDPVTPAFLDYLNNEAFIIDVFGNAANPEDTAVRWSVGFGFDTHTILQDMMEKMEELAEEEEKEAVEFPELAALATDVKRSGSVTGGLSRDASPRVQRRDSAKSNSPRSSLVGGATVTVSVIPALTAEQEKEKGSEPVHLDAVRAAATGESPMRSRGGGTGVGVGGKGPSPLAVRSSSPRGGDGSPSSMSMDSDGTDEADGTPGSSPRKLRPSHSIVSAASSEENEDARHLVFRHDDDDAEAAAARIQSVVRGNIVRAAQRRRAAEVEAKVRADAEAKAKADKEAEVARKRRKEAESVQAELEALRQKMKLLETENQRLGAAAGGAVSPTPPSRRVGQRPGFKFLTPEARQQARMGSAEGSSQACAIL